MKKLNDQESENSDGQNKGDNDASLTKPLAQVFAMVLFILVLGCLFTLFYSLSHIGF